MSPARLFAMSILMLGSLQVVGAAPAQAYINDCQETPDRAAWGCVSAGGSGSDSVNAQDRACDARGPRIYYRIGSGSWSSHGNAAGCNTTTSKVLPKMSLGTLVSYYVCNTNTNTGYRSCSGTRTVRVS